MCRSIKKLRRPDNPPTDDEIHAAALQFVRKISGYRKPSQTNHDVFEAAVDEITAVSHVLLASLTTRGLPSAPPVDMPRGLLP